MAAKTKRWRKEDRQQAATPHMSSSPDERKSEVRTANDAKEVRKRSSDMRRPAGGADGILGGGLTKLRSRGPSPRRRSIDGERSGGNVRQYGDGDEHLRCYGDLKCARISPAAVATHTYVRTDRRTDSREADAMCLQRSDSLLLSRATNGVGESRTGPLGRFW